MKNLLTIQDNLTNKISFYHIVLFLAALPFDQFYSQIILISFIIHTLIHLKKNEIRQLPWKEILILQSVFIITLVCTIYSINKNEAFSLWMRQLSIFLFPVFIFLNPINLKKYEKKILLGFAFVCTVVICYLYYDVLKTIGFNHLPFSSLFSSYFMNHNFSEPLDIHATYLSLYIVTAIVTLINYYFTEPEKQTRVLYFICSCILLAGLIQLGSRAAMIAFLIMLILVVPFSLNGRKRVLFLIFSLLAIALVSLIIIYFDTYQTRFVDDLKNDLSEASLANTTTDSRMKRWDAAMELVKKSPVFGYGSGEEIDLLKDEYFERKLYSSYLHSLNAHNQYISFLLTGGLIALTAFMLTLIFGVKTALRSKNTLFLCFIILIIVVSISENLLSRNKGIFFYSFFFSFFICMGKKSKELHD